MKNTAFIPYGRAPGKNWKKEEYKIETQNIVMYEEELMKMSLPVRVLGVT